MKIFKSILLQFKRHSLTFIFLVVVYMMALLIISIGITQNNEVKRLALERTEGEPKNQLSVTVNLTDIKFDQICSAFNKIQNNSLIRTETAGQVKTLSDDNEFFTITYEFFKENPDWTYPLLSGRYYTSEDLENCHKVVLIGKDLENKIQTTENKKFITVERETYEVIGIIGKKESSPWDNSIFMPLTAISQGGKREFIEQQMINFKILNSNGDTYSDYLKIAEELKKIKDDIIINAEDTKNSEDLVANVTSSEITIETYLMYILAVINAANISFMWTEERKYEIGIKKAFGHENKKIALNIFKENMAITIFSCILGLLIQFILYETIQNKSTLYLKLGIENYILGIIFVTISTILSSILAVYKTFKISPRDIISARRTN